MDSDEWKLQVVRLGRPVCPQCESVRLTMGACAVGAKTVHQELICEDCNYEFTALYVLAGCYSGHPEI